MAPENKQPGPFQKLNLALNKSIQNRAESNDPTSEVFINSVLSDLSEEIDKIRTLDKPELWKRIYIARDNAKIRVEILNRLMAMGGKN